MQEFNTSRWRRFCSWVAKPSRNSSISAAVDTCQVRNETGSTQSPCDALGTTCELNQQKNPSPRHLPAAVETLALHLQAAACCDWWQTPACPAKSAVPCSVPPSEGGQSHHPRPQLWCASAVSLVPGPCCCLLMPLNLMDNTLLFKTTQQEDTLLLHSAPSCCTQLPLTAAQWSN